MNYLLHRSFERVTRARTVPIASAACAALALVFFSCGSNPPARREVAPGDEGMLPLRYSLVCIIHGDGGYRYHDTGGNAHKADEVTLAKAITVAEQNPQAEMFIFHEMRRRHFMFIFPRRDGILYYYRNGSLIAKTSYWRDQGESRFDTETKLYKLFRAEDTPGRANIFLYFGHEIPEFGGTGYDASYGNRSFTVADLAEGLRGFLRDSTKFDLVVLSTCFNGTPHTVKALAPFARYVIASPENLHLSYFDLGPFERLNIGLGEKDMFGFAKTYARHAFDRLTEELQTTVTVVVYDMLIVRPFLRSVSGVYEQTLNSLNGKAPGSIERCDCAENPAYALPGMSKGVTVLYRAPQFGRMKSKESHSGWECWRVVK